VSIYLKQKKIFILGAGYGGLPCAVRLASHLSRLKGVPPAKITVVNRDPRQELVCELYRTLRNGKSEMLALNKILKRKHVEFLEGNVFHVDPVNKILQVRGEQSFKGSYDILVVALGNQVMIPSIEGLSELMTPRNHSEQRIFQFRNNQQALALRMALKRIGWSPEQKLDRDVFTVVMGAGITGIEVAGELAALRKRNSRARTILIDSKHRLLEGFSPIGSKLFSRELKQLSIEMILGSPAVKVSEKEIFLGNRQVIPWDLMVLCAGSGPGPAPLSWFKEKSSLDEERVSLFTSGLNVRPNLEVLGYPNHYAIGDIAQREVSVESDSDSAVNFKLAQIAEQQGHFVADQIYQKLVEPEEYKNLPFVPHERGFLISLGPRSGIGRMGPEIQNPFLRLLSPFVVGPAVDRLKKIAAQRYKMSVLSGARWF